MKTKFIFYVVVSSVFFGCSTPAEKLQSTYNKENREGLVVGTIYIENKNASSYTFVYGDDKLAMADHPNNINKFSYKYVGDFNLDKKSYFLFSIAKPKGKYKFHRVEVFDNTREKIEQFDVPMDVNFEVVEGKTTYLGQLNVNVQKKEFSVENQIDRDRIWFAKKAPQIQF